MSAQSRTRQLDPGARRSEFHHFLIWTTLGNALGGPFFVAIIKYNHAITAAKTAG